MDNGSASNVTYYLEIYGALAAGNTFFTLFRAFLFAYGGICAAACIHDKHLGAVSKVWYLYLILWLRSMVMIVIQIYGLDLGVVPFKDKRKWLSGADILPASPVSPALSFPSCINWMSPHNIPVLEGLCHILYKRLYLCSWALTTIGVYWGPRRSLERSN